MFGKNAIMKPLPADSDFFVHSIFYTIQGEGPWAGMPTIFVRFAGCNLRCFWCDTDFEKGEWMSALTLRDKLLELEKQHKCNKFVLTGGEPMLQPLQQLLDVVPLHWTFQIETAGTVWPAGIGEAVEDGQVLLVCSPKTGMVHRMIREHCAHWKFIVSVEDLEHLDLDGLPMMSTQVEGQPLRIFRPVYEDNVDKDPIIYVQARDDQDPAKNQANLEAAAKIALTHGYRLSVQLHKLVGLP